MFGSKYYESKKLFSNRMLTVPYTSLTVHFHDMQYVAQHHQELPRMLSNI